jgi:tetratricopeptide (TPR) repeat protein
LWRRISLTHVNVVLYAAIAVLLAAYAPEIWWAIREVPGYCSGSIRAPIERRLCVEAGERIAAGRADDRTRSLLERSLAIDPHGDAVCLMGSYQFENDRYDRAERRFRTCLREDPGQIEAYFLLATILERTDRTDEAERVLREGLDHFEGSADRLEPRLDPYVDPACNARATELHEHYLASAERLRRRLGRADGTGDPTAHRGDRADRP